MKNRQSPARLWKPIFGTGLLVLLLWCPAARATISISPRTMVLKMGQGARQNLQFLVVNEDPADSHAVRFRPASFQEQEDGSFQILPDTAGDTAFSCRRWFQQDTQRIDLAPGEGRYVTVSVVVPPGVRGTRYGAICFDQLPKPQLRQNYADVTLTIRMPAYVEITIPGARYLGKPELDSVQIVPASAVAKYLPVGTPTKGLAFTALAKNTGEAALPIRGRILLKDEQGRRAREIPLSAGGRLLPGARVKLISLTEPVRNGSYIAEASLFYGGVSPVKAAASVLIAGGTVASQSATRVAPTLSVTVSTSQVEMNVAPKSFRSQYVILRNEGDSPVSLAARLMYLKNDIDGNLLESDAGDPSRSCAEWLVIDPAQIEIEPGASKPVKLALQLPDSVSGSYYSCLYLEDQGGNQPAASGQPRATISIPVLVAVRDSATPKATITSVGFTTDPAGASVTIRNDGAMYLKPKVRAVFRPTGSGASGANPGAQAVEMGSDEVILPGSSVRISGRGTYRLPRGNYQLSITADCGKLQLRSSKDVSAN